MKIRVRHPAIGEAVFLLGAQSVVTLGRCGHSAACEFGWDPAISARHARMWIDGGRVWFEDLGSANGSFLGGSVGGQRIEGRVALRPGDTVRLGSTTLSVPDELDAWLEEEGPLWAPSAIEPAPASASEWTKDLPRRHPRHVTKHPVVVRTSSNAEPRLAYVRDVSRGGMFIEARHPPAVGTHLVIEIDRDEGTLVLEGVVRHVVDRTRSRAYTIPTGVGVEVLGLTGVVEAEWLHFLADLGVPGVTRSVKEMPAPRRPAPLSLPDPDPEPAAPWWRSLANVFVPSWQRI